MRALAPKPNRVSHAKDGGIDADAERERKHRDRRKTRRFDKQPNAVTKVLPEYAHLSLQEISKGKWQEGGPLIFITLPFDIHRSYRNAITGSTFIAPRAGS